MAGLPSVQAAKKAQMEVTLPPIEQQKPAVKRPVPVQVVSTPKKEDKVDDKPLDEAQFVVEDTPSTQVEKKDDVVIEQPPAIVEKKDSEANEWKWKFESLRGNHEKIVDENRDLRDRLVVLEAKFDEAAKKPVVPMKEEPSVELTKEELEEYGPVLPVLDKLLAKQRHIIQESVVKPLQEKVTSLEKNTIDSTKKFQDSEEAIFWQQVKSNVPEVEKLTSKQNQKWLEFASKPLSEYTDETVGASLLKAHAKRDLTKVVKILNDFSKSQPTTVVDAFRAPTVSSAAGELPNNDLKKPKLAWSKREEASIKFRKRQIDLGEFNKIAELYRQADKEGRVDYDK